MDDGSDYDSTKAIALRLLLGQVAGNSESVDDTHQEIEASLTSDPNRTNKVLAHLLGIAAAEIVLRHHDDREAAAKTIELRLADLLDG